MPTKPTPQKTLKQEKLWLIDEKKGEIYYDVTDDVNHGWWHKLGTDYGGTSRQQAGQSGDFVRVSTTSGIQWLDHHSQAYNDSDRHHPQRHDVEITNSTATPKRK